MYARRNPAPQWQGISAFWGSTPRSDSETQMRWAALDGTQFVMPAGDTRCILVSNHAEDVFASQAFYATLEPCEAKLADGLVCESVSAYPPPPPGDQQSPSPPLLPPPPPVYLSAGLRQYVQEVVEPRTRMICEAGAIGRDLDSICIEMASTLGTPHSAGVVAAVTGLCEPEMCWHSCGGVDQNDVDSFENCQSADCTDSWCLDFLKRECNSHIHAALDRAFDAACSLSSPSPPGSPFAPPAPPALPGDASGWPSPPPSPPAGLETRNAALETDSDLDCAPSSYDQCLSAQQHAAKTDSRLSTRIEVITAVCTGSDEDKNLGLSCFEGCSFGSTSGAPAQFHFIRPGANGEWMTRRCADNLLHPFCLCASPSPPPPLKASATEGPVWAGRAGKPSYMGMPSGYYQEAVVGRTFPSSWAAGSTMYDCVGEDTGAEQCTRFCASEYGLHAKAFTVRGTTMPPSPPFPSPPPSPPMEPQSPSQPFDVFNGASEGCVTNGIIGLNYDVCRDSGPGSVLPPVCDYGSQVI